MGIVVRPYEANDREAVRHICYETGYMGDPIWYWRDRLSFTDIWTRYYTDHEPESTFIVLDEAGEVGGFLLGCVDSRRAVDPGRYALSHAVRRGCALRPGTAGIMWRAAADSVIDTMIRRQPFAGPFHDERWPSHLHIDLLGSVRRLGAGRALMEAWFSRLASVGSPGCHLETMVENERAVAFFESVGFRQHGPIAPIPGVRTRDGGRHHRLLMVRAVEPEDADA